eukprot:2536631-Pleurochrysis_carterae.AAC.1
MGNCHDDEGVLLDMLNAIQLSARTRTLTRTLNPMSTRMRTLALTTRHTHAHDCMRIHADGT